MFKHVHINKKDDYKPCLNKKITQEHDKLHQ